MKNFKFVPFLMFGLLAAVFCLQPTPATGQETLYLGSHLELTGPAAVWGTPSLPGLQLAVEEINAAGGFKIKNKTYKIKLLEGDNEGKAEQAVAVVNKQLAEYHPPIIFGGTTSTPSAPVAEMCKSRKDFILIGAATILAKKAMEAHKAGIPLVFRTITPNEYMSPEMVDYIVDKLGFQKVAMLVADDEIGHQIVDIEFSPQFRRRGIKITDVLYFPRDTQDFYAFLSRVKPNKPDVILAAYLDAHVQGIIRQALELKITKTFINRGGSAGGALPFKEQIENYFYQIQVVDDIDITQDPKLLAWKERYKKRFNRLPDNNHNDSSALFYYDFVFMATKAMQMAGTVTDIKEISKALHKIEYTGVGGKLSYDKFGRCVGDTRIGHMVKGGKTTTIVIHPRPDLAPVE